MFRSLLMIAAILLPIAATACGDDGSKGAERTISPVATRAFVTTSTPSSGGAATVGPETPAGDAGAEVTGIVGVVNLNDGRIEINRLSGANVEVVVVTTATRIRSGRGTQLVIDDVRPSDRIIAHGTVDGAEMMATTIEIQAVIPNMQPGG